MGILSADQVSVFLAVVDRGSFSAAARALGRRQSAVSYAIANLEDQLGVALFDRSGARPSLTVAGRALLPDARKATYNLDTMRARAGGLSRGVEAELTVVADCLCPLDVLAGVMSDFSSRFPMVRPSIHVELMHNALARVLAGGVVGLLSHPMGAREDLDQFPTGRSYEMGPVVSIGHPMVRSRVLLHEDVYDHIQLVLGDDRGLSTGQEMGILSRRTYQSNDLRAHQAMLFAGVGWAFMPIHTVENAILAGELVRLDLPAWPAGGWVQVPITAVRHADSALGPAGAWLLEHLLETPMA